MPPFHSLHSMYCMDDLFPISVGMFNMQSIESARRKNRRGKSQKRNRK